MTGLALPRNSMDLWPSVCAGKHSMVFRGRNYLGKICTNRPRRGPEPARTRVSGFRGGCHSSRKACRVQQMRLAGGKE